MEVLFFPGLFLYVFDSDFAVFCFCCFSAFAAFLLLLHFGFCCFSAFCVFVFLLFAFVAFLLWQLFSFLPFSFCFCVSLFLLCREETKQESKQASTSCSPLDLVCCWRGRCAPPNPPRATKSALHLRHPRLPRNQYFKVNSPVQKLLTNQIRLLC